jgi:adenylate cyclase
MAEGGSRFTEGELADRAGAPVERVRKLRELEVIHPGRDGLFNLGDIHRIRLLEAFERAGIPPEAIGGSVGSGDLSLSFVDMVYSQPREPAGKTYRELAVEYRLPEHLIPRVWEAFGIPEPDLDAIADQDDRDIFAVGRVALDLGMEEGAILRVLRVYAENLYRITQSEPEFFHTHVEEPLLRSGMTEQQMRDLSSQTSEIVRPMIQRMMRWVYVRHQEHFTTAHLVEHVEEAMERAGLVVRRQGPPPAISFLDLTGYTRLTEELGDRAAAELAERLAGLSHEAARDHGGRPVKWLGDGVMFHFTDPGAAVTASLEMVDRTPVQGLPPAHVGVDAGPVVVRGGDFYGRTVNVAARISSHAGPGEVLVSEPVLEVARPPDVRFEPIGPVALKGLSRPVSLHRALWDRRG